MITMALPEDLLWHLIGFLPWRDMIAYGSTCKMLMKWVFVGPFNQLDDSIKSQSGTMLYQYEELCHNEEHQRPLYKLKQIYSRLVGDPYNLRWISTKMYADKCYIMNILLNEQLKVWSPFFYTNQFEKTEKYWIASLPCGTNTYGPISRTFIPASPQYDTLVRMVQSMTWLTRDAIPRCTEVMVVGCPYREWDHTPPTPLRAMSRLKVYAQRTKDTAAYRPQKKRRTMYGSSETTVNLQWTGNEVHIPTEYIDAKGHTIKKSFHARQAMDLRRGKRCKVRMTFSVYPGKKRWEWYIRCMFDKIRIYVN